MGEKVEGLPQFTSEKCFLDLTLPYNKKLIEVEPAIKGGGQKGRPFFSESKGGGRDFPKKRGLLRTFFSTQKLNFFWRVSREVV